MNEQVLTKEEKELIRQARNAYHREWYAKNKKRLKEKSDLYWLRKAKAEQTGESGKEDARADGE